MKRKHKRYSRPKKIYNKTRIEEEKALKKEFGLKNKREIWKAEAKISSIREKAKKLISSDAEKQQSLFDSLGKIGLKVNSIGDVLTLDKRDYLKRRLQTILFMKKFVSTPKAARQLIAHKKVLINGDAINIPSYIVPVELENKISIRERKRKEKPIEVKQESENA
jgi:small subunit ribosomal protein S4